MATTTERREQLNKAVDTLRTSEGWAAWLQMRSRFHSYSFANSMLIALQCPEATMVTGYGAKDGSTGWLSMGRQVRKGEKAIKIFAPMFGRKDDKGDKPLIGFKVVNVFDVGQTDGDDLPENPGKPTLLEGEAPAGMIDAMLTLAATEGIDVRFVPRADLGSANGYVVIETKQMVICDEMSDAAKAKTLAHEMSHWFDHGKAGNDHRIGRDESECVAESSAFLVCAEMGLSSDPYSVGYVATWAGTKTDILEKVAKRCDDAANWVIKGIKANLPNSGEAA